MSRPTYYTDTLEQLRRFDAAKAKKDEQKKVDEMRYLLPQGHGSGLNADMLDNYHAQDLLREMDSKIAGIRRGGHGGGGFPNNENNWEDLRFPVSGIRLGGAAPPTFQAYRGGAVLSFSSSVNQYVYVTAQMPHSRTDDSEIIPHIHWTIPVKGGEGAAENVKWDLTYSWANIGDTFPVQSSDSETRNVASDAANEHLLTAWDDIDGTDKELSSMLIMSIMRDTTVVGDYADVALMLEFDIHYKQDKLGSDLDHP